MEFLLIILVIFGGFMAYYLHKEPVTKTYPRLTNAMFNADGVISTVDAKRLFRKYMLDIGFYDKEEISSQVEYFSEAINDRISDMKDEIDSAKDTLAEAKKEAKDFTGLTNEEIVEAKANLQNDIQWAQDELTAAQDMLNKFKADKREFLIEYINDQTQGHH